MTVNVMRRCLKHLPVIDSQMKTIVFSVKRKFRDALLPQYLQGQLTKTLEAGVRLK